MKPRAIVVHPPFGPGGGGELLAAWVLQALVDDFAVTLISVEPVVWDAIDARFGTRLATAGITVITPPPMWQTLLRRWPPKADRVRWALLERLSAQLVPPPFDSAQGSPKESRGARDGDLWVSTCNEMCLPQPGLQYVHFPTPRLLPDAELGWLKQPFSIRRAYLTLCRRIAGSRVVDYRQHRTLVNSHFSAAVWRDTHGTSAAVVYPPVPPLIAGKPWSERVDRAVCLGRLLPGKGLERVVAIVAGARSRGANLKLAIAGKWDCTAAERRQLRRVLEARSWIELHENPSRAALANLVASSRYGLHGMVNEPFGIAVAELQDSGAITFAPASGGPPEIVEDDRLLYRDEADGVEKLLRVLRQPRLQDELRQRAARRAGRFSPASFVDQIRGQVMTLKHGRQAAAAKARSA